MKSFRPIIASIFLLSFAVVCSQLRGNIVSDDLSKIPPTSIAKVMEIENNFPKLKVGMPAEKVLPILYLTNYHDIVFGSGPVSDYRSFYRLSRGYSLLIAIDMTKKPPILNWAELRNDEGTIRRIGK